MGLGLRLAVAGGREAITRLALVAVAVAIGTALLLATLAGINAVDAQNQRYAWLQTAYDGSNAPGGEIGATTGADPLWWMLRADYFDGERIGRVDVAPTGADSPVPPGIDALPGSGEMYASPALARLLATTPAAELGDRFHDATVIGTIGDAALPAPDSLIAIVGHTPEELSQQGRATTVTSISTISPSRCESGCALGVGINANGMTLILSVVAAALLFPVLIFIGGATRLSAARREQRFAAMRLLGATPRQIAVIAAVESCVAAGSGVVGGFGLFVVARPLLARIPFTGERFFTSDLALTSANVAFVAVGIPVGAAIAARLALRRVTISPLGVTRRVTPAAPRAWRLVPVVAGIAWLVYLAYVSDLRESASSAAQAYAYLAGILTIIAGLAIAGPWLTQLGSRIMAGRATRPAPLLAGRRLADNPHAGFRAMSGLVIALFIGTCAIGVITTIVAHNEGNAGDPTLTSGTLVSRIGWQPADGDNVPVSPATVDALRALDGVTGIAVIHSDPKSSITDDEPPRFYVSCADLAGVPAFGHCPANAQTVSILPHYSGGVVDQSTPMSETTWPTAELSAATVDGYPVATLAVATNGSDAVVEQARTVLELADPATFPPQTLSELNAENSRTLDNYRQLANVVILASLPIAGCSLAVSIAAGLADRKRPFSLLRLSGTPLRVLRRVVLLESAVPLLLGAALAVGAGLAAAFLVLRAQTGYTLEAPGVAYYLITVAGLLAALAVIASTLPLLRRLTGPDTARNE